MTFRSFRCSISRCKYWQHYINNNEDASCIYSGVPLRNAKIAIDHFVPWSYVVHNEIWNLVQTTPSVNLSKSDCLPNLDTYLASFCKIQQDAFKQTFHSHDTKRDDWLGGYTQIFGHQLSEIAAMDGDVFRLSLERTIKPLV